MQFKKFNSLDNTYISKLIEKITFEGHDLPTVQWVVTEKIHGANFSFWSDGTEVHVASRTQFVDGTFYNCQAVIDKHAADILAFHQKNMSTLGDVLVIYGELCGDGVQKGVRYGDKHFLGFDVSIDGVPMHKSFAFSLMHECGVPNVHVMRVGTFAECLGVTNTFRSHNTPESVPADVENTAEGYVIEPMQPTWFRNGSRVYLKNKSLGFSEKKQRTSTVTVDNPLNETQTDLLDQLLAYATPARVSNVLSKIGKVEPKEFGKILGLTVRDMLEDFEKETEIVLKDEVEDSWKNFLAAVNRETMQVVRPVFLEAIYE